MGYYDELKQIRKDVRKELRKAGVKASVRGNQGSSLFWTDISPKGDQWGEKELKVLRKDFGIHVGHPQNSATIPMERLKAHLGGYRARKFKKKPAYQKLKEDFTKVAMKQRDEGTCVLGAGTVVVKGDQHIDFWRQHGQGESRDWVAQKIMANRAKKLGLTFKHEGGTMD